MQLLEGDLSLFEPPLPEIHGAERVERVQVIGMLRRVKLEKDPKPCVVRCRERRERKTRQAVGGDGVELERFLVGGDGRGQIHFLVKEVAEGHVDRRVVEAGLDRALNRAER